MMTQKEEVLRHLREMGSLSSFEAFAYYGITRLSARVHELRKDGYTIRGTVQKVKSRNGKTVMFERYRLSDE